jgi:hypothetical protein
MRATQFPMKSFTGNIDPSKSLEILGPKIGQILDSVSNEDDKSQVPALILLQVVLPHQVVLKVTPFFLIEFFDFLGLLVY